MDNEPEVEEAAERPAVNHESDVDEAAERADKLVRDMLTRLHRMHPEKDRFDIGTVAVIVEVNRGVNFFCTDNRPWVQTGLLGEAMRIAEDIKSPARKLTGEPPRRRWLRKG